MTDTHLLGRGIYDAAEIARLVHAEPDDVARWATPTQRHDALLHPVEGRLLSFYDLVTAIVTSELLRRGAPLLKVRDARRTLAQEFEVEWPLAHLAALNKLASVGRDVFVEIDMEWVDAGRGGQRAFQDVVVPLLHRIDFDRVNQMALIWRPADGVVVNPSVQAGAPCIEGTRVSTQFVADLVDAGEDPADVAADLDLDADVVRAAVEFEHGLAAA